MSKSRIKSTQFALYKVAFAREAVLTLERPGGGGSNGPLISFSRPKIWNVQAIKMKLPVPSVR